MAWTKSLFSEPKIFHALNTMQFSNIRRDPARSSLVSSLVADQLRASGHRTQRPRVMTKQSRTPCRVQKQREGENRLVSWRFLLSRRRIVNDVTQLLSIFAT